ncbi:VacJ family lipoprotein [Uruburuella testudinis]|uniref:VacJ family lipoprotein n=1 Tax=Uruburuella testudinis TaxID=1282863 RepID=A0ABY4DSL7_9NEIS|nr:VacJ family lipoprotein [Uruburuella testudinis]UOO81893.1 VacJ family lipoprotein [Uruburuella testudinis]
MKHQRSAACIALMLAASQPVWAETNPDDPYERYNRVMYKVNDTADRYVLTPVARGYRAVTPKPVRTGVSNFFNNLRDVVSFGSNVLRLDIKRASEDLVRVGINTTFGLGGLINIADAGQMPNNKNTLGDTFASWGWKKSHYFVYPLLGPSTVRDSVGTTIVSVYPVQNAVFDKPAARIGAVALNAANTREGLLDLTDSLDAAAVDKYAYTRDMYMRLRAGQTGAPLPQSAGDDVDIDDLVDAGSEPAPEVAAPDAQDTADTAAIPDEPAAELDEWQPQSHTDQAVIGLWQPDSRLAY